jgi:hypothetical protein
MSTIAMEHRPIVQKLANKINTLRIGLDNNEKCVNSDTEDGKFKIDAVQAFQAIPKIESEIYILMCLITEEAKENNKKVDNWTLNLYIHSPMNTLKQKVISQHPFLKY